MLRKRVSECLACLYLDWGEYGRAYSPAAWHVLERALWAGECAPEALDRRGLWEAASILRNTARFEQARQAIQAGTVLTAASSSYPVAWRSNPKSHAPPALWVACTSSSVSEIPAKLLGIVGSRNPSPRVLGVVQQSVEWAASLGFGVLSGGAPGVDRLARQACLDLGVPIVEILPCGLQSDLSWRHPNVIQLSTSRANHGFSSFKAMERNRLIYAAADLTLVFEPRFKAGGTWHGAVGSLRQRLGHPAVWAAPASPAVQALVALGASGWSQISDLPSLLHRQAGHPALFPASTWISQAS